MSQQSLNAPGAGGDEPGAGDEAVTGGQTFASAQGADDLLDEIDSVLEANAETFVRSFVQKGGQ
ncbi:ubiquitin-like protein Pup [Brachybacterium saurashtrense]|uniref:Prokaryotic ubiquitin-like protein Pup n=1 Tax=Brachybacterium saurashtrense TaxID=556288 RepID=A0A345YMI8_9MICO|nr:ubiquitin-like protein Pup [Brachybacterium saurashtrense]AXK45140.1 ubiquitin-like protein Pup [Brachybacterium saurashtrense]RRR22107.1 ubiquitin-like protein Pup [Brachybacterium saurashtrense]